MNEYMPVMLFNPEYLTAGAVKCDHCGDITIGLTFVSTEPPLSLNILLPIESFEEMIRQARKGIADPNQSLNGEAIPTKEIDWHTLPTPNVHD